MFLFVIGTSVELYKLFTFFSAPAMLDLNI